MRKTKAFLKLINFNNVRARGEYEKEALPKQKRPFFVSIETRNYFKLLILRAGLYLGGDGEVFIGIVLRIDYLLGRSYYHT